MIKEHLKHNSIKPIEHYQNIHFINPFTNSFDIKHFMAMQDSHLFFKNEAYFYDELDSIDFHFENFYRFQKYYYRLMVKKEVTLLERVFKNDSNEKLEYVNFIALIQLSIKLNPLFKLYKDLTSRDFENFISHSTIFDTSFLSFHIDNYFFNTDWTKKTTDELKRYKDIIFNLYSIDKKIHSDKALSNLLSHAQLINSQLIYIFRNEKYDKYFDDFYSYYAELLGLSKIEIVNYLMNAGDDYSIITDKLYQVWNITDED